MTDPTQAEKQYFDAVREGQQAIVDAVEAWSKGVERLAVSYPPVRGAPELPTAQEVVENAFDFAEKLLAAQREFARNLLEAAAPALSRQPATDEGPQEKTDA